MFFFLVTEITLKKNPQKGHHQLSTADIPGDMQSNFIKMLNTQYIKYHI